jgi:hypothetical protein
MACAVVTERGVVVTWQPSEVIDPLNPGDQDDARIEWSLAEALADHGITCAELDATTDPEPWNEQVVGKSRERELVQVFRWREGVSRPAWAALGSTHSEATK